METLEENLKNWSNSYLEDREDYLLAKQFDSLEHTLTNLVPRVDLKRNESNTSVNVVIKQEPVSTSSIFGRNLFNYGDSKRKLCSCFHARPKRSVLQKLIKVLFRLYGRGSLMLLRKASRSPNWSCCTT